MTRRGYWNRRKLFREYVRAYFTVYIPLDLRDPRIHTLYICIISKYKFTFQNTFVVVHAHRNKFIIWKKREIKGTVSLELRWILL